MRSLAIILLLSITFSMRAQETNSDEKLIQFSGNTLVSMGDSIDPVAFVLIKNKSRKSGAYSGPDGFFSLVVMRGDTVEFSSVGFRKSVLIIPENIQREKFFATQVMIRDTQRLQAAVIVPWKNVEELKRAVLDLEISDDDLITAYQNLQYEKWSAIRDNLPPSPEENRRTLLQQRNQTNLLQSTGLLPANNLLNPWAWASFIDYLSSKKKKKSNIDNNNKF